MRRTLLPAMIALAAALAFFSSALYAADDPPTDTNPALEEQVQRIAQELRCLVCQNQTIADSNADLARDLRREVRRMLATGASEQQVREFMVARYGDFVLYRPPVKATTVALWIGPFVLLALAFWVARRILLARRSLQHRSTLTADEAARLRTLLGNGEPDAR